MNTPNCACEENTAQVCFMCNSGYYLSTTSTACIACTAACSGSTPHEYRACSRTSSFDRVCSASVHPDEVSHGLRFYHQKELDSLSGAPVVAIIAALIDHDADLDVVFASLPATSSATGEIVWLANPLLGPTITGPGSVNATQVACSDGT